MEEVDRMVIVLSRQKTIIQVPLLDSGGSEWIKSKDDSKALHRESVKEMKCLVFQKLLKKQSFFFSFLFTRYLEVMKFCNYKKQKMNKKKV